MLLLTELGRFPNKAVQVCGDPLTASNAVGTLVGLETNKCANCS